MHLHPLDVVDGGGLCCIREEMYNLFSAVEEELRENDQAMSTPSQEVIKQKVINAIHDNEKVLFHWCIYIQDEDAHVVLKMLIELWTTT